jgi:putative transposase
VVLTHWVHRWRDVLLDWHRQLFKLVWRHKSARPARKSPLADETLALIKLMAIENQRWGAERIRGELLKLGLHVSKRTIQKYMRQAPYPQKTSSDP